MRHRLTLAIFWGVTMVTLAAALAFALR